MQILSKIFTLFWDNKISKKAILPTGIKAEEWKCTASWKFIFDELIDPFLHIICVCVYPACQVKFIYKNRRYYSTVGYA